jgi:hypothetical protein
MPYQYVPIDRHLSTPQFTVPFTQFRFRYKSIHCLVLVAHLGLSWRRPLMLFSAQRTLVRQRHSREFVGFQFWAFRHIVSPAYVRRTGRLSPTSLHLGHFGPSGDPYTSGGTCGYHHITTINEIFMALGLFLPGSLIVPLCQPSNCPCTRFSSLATVLIMRLFPVTPDRRANRDSSVSSHISCLFASNLV